jgi:hypothetical protein
MAASSSLDHLSNRMKLEWHSKLNTEMVPAKNFRRTSIICTIGMSLIGAPAIRVSAVRQILNPTGMNLTDARSLSRPQDELRGEDQRSPQRYGNTFNAIRRDSD